MSKTAALESQVDPAIEQKNHLHWLLKNFFEHLARGGGDNMQTERAGWEQCTSQQI